MLLSGKKLLRLLCITLSLICVLSLAQPVSAVMEQVPGTAIYKYASKVYRYPSTSSALIGQIAHGTELKVLEETDHFYKIDCSGMSGYIPKLQVARNYKLTTYTVSCVPANENTVVLEYIPLAEALPLRDSILSLAKDQLGTPYVYGGMSRYGFDCSGFTSYVYAKHDTTLFRCADDQMQNGLIVEYDDLRPGDLLFFRFSHTPWLAAHVGIYAGNGKMIHSGTSRGICIVDLSDSYWANSYVGARRIIPVDTSATTQNPLPSIATESATNIRITQQHSVQRAEH